MTQQRHIPFSLVGCFLGFVNNKKQQPKFLRIATLEGEWQVKLAKELRDRDYSDWKLGAQVHVWGHQKMEDAKLHLKAERVELAAQPPISPLPPIVPPPTNTTVTTPRRPNKPAVIRVCRKSDCMKKGGKEVCRTIEKMITDFGLEHDVQIQGTGCMKNCKAAPNLVVMPDKQRYSKVKPKEVAAILEEHFVPAASVNLPA
jgi:(2Fe-2S) ferredoxin